MKVIFSEKDNSYNFIHNNGMQTSIKVSPSGSFTPEQMDRDNPYTVDKNKYTVIISSSVGCQMACSFCHLTKNNKIFEGVTSDIIIDNVLEAITYVDASQSLSARYIKLCFMGEGEPILDMNKTRDIAENLIQLVTEKGMAAGLDGVDISTCMPKVPKSALLGLQKLDKTLVKEGYPLNPYNHNEGGRTVVRLFYSLHHYSQYERDNIIPNTHTIERAIDIMSDVGVNVVVHYMFMQGVNDSEKDLQDLVSFVNTTKAFRDYEFRVLRYNSYNLLDSGESSRMVEVINYISKNLNVKKFKVQFSAGEDIKAACGMFL